MPTFEALPHAVQLRIFALVPLDTRLRCVEVCRAWRSTLRDSEAWARLVVPASSRPTRSDLMLRAALQRAGWKLEMLDVSTSTMDSTVFDLFTQLGLGAALRELRLSSHQPLLATEITEFLQVAPELQLLCVTATWKDRVCFDQSAAILRNEHPFEAVRVCTLVLHTEWIDAAVLAEGNSEFYQPYFAELKDAVAQCTHSELRELGVDCSVDAVIMRYIADVAETRTPALLVSGLDMNYEWQSGCIDVVVRLLRSNALPYLTFGLWAAELLREGDPAVWTELCEAVRGCTSLKTVVIDMRVVQRLSRLNELIATLVNHPHVENITVIDVTDLAQELMDGERLDPVPKLLEIDASYKLGRGLAALLAANLPGLRTLSLVDMGLDETGLALVLRSLSRNTHLEELYLGWRESCWANNPAPSVPPYFSMDFIESELFPAVQRNRSLRSLVVNFRSDDQRTVVWDLDEEQLERQQASRTVEAFVRGRGGPAAQAAARGWQVARYKWTAPRAPR